jgi:hypothetical protein
MKKILILPGLIFLANSLIFAQRELPGYIISPTGDTIRGSFKRTANEKQYLGMKFRKAGESTINFVSPDSVSHLNLSGEDFVSHKVTIMPETPSGLIQRSDLYRYPKDTIQAFLRYVTGGRIDMYYARIDQDVHVSYFPNDIFFLHKDST